MKSTRFKKIKKNKGILFIVLVALILRLVGILPNISHPDEAFIQLKSWDLVKSFLTSGNINPNTFKYGSITFYLQALATLPVFLATYAVEAANTLISSSFTSKVLDFNLFFVEAVRKYSDSLLFFGRLQTVIFGVLSVVVVYLIVSSLFNKKAALLAALMLAISPIHVRDSHYITNDILYTFSLLVVVYATSLAIKTRKLKWFLLSGFTTGLSVTIRYFPLSFLVFPFGLLLTFSNKKDWWSKAFASVLFIVFGFFVGIPFLFLDKTGPVKLMEDLQRYALPWYGTSLSNYAFSLIQAVITRSPIPDISSAFTSSQHFRPVHASWIFFNGFGILPTIVSILGGIYLFVKSKSKVLLILSLPLFNFVYISFFIPATYERLIIPTIPFLAMLVGIFIDSVLTNLKLNKYSLGVIVTVAMIFAPSAMTSVGASIACSDKKVQMLSHDWVDKNIQTSAKIGYLTMVTIPPKEYGRWYQLEPGQKLSLAEAQNEDLDHVFFNAARLDYNTYHFFNMFFVPPAEIFQNSYYSLVLSEYFSKARLLGSVQKPWMCDIARIYYFQIPHAEEEKKKVINNTNFTSEGDLQKWTIKNVDDTGKGKILFNDKVGKNNIGSLEYNQSSYAFTPPRIIYETFNVRPEKTYTFSFWIRANNESVNKPTVIGRIDFYNKGRGILESISQKVKNVGLLLQEGPTQMYYEKSRMSQFSFSNTDLPGLGLSLSPLSYIDNNWQKVTVTGDVPKEAEYALFSIQPISTEATTLYIDDIEVRE